MTKIPFLDTHLMLWSCQKCNKILFYLEMLVKMYKLEHKIETTVSIKFNKTGAVDVHSNVFIFA